MADVVGWLVILMAFNIAVGIISIVILIAVFVMILNTHYYPTK